MPYKDFQPETLETTDVQPYLMNQSIMTFANATARSAALATPTEGMVTYLQDVDRTQVYTGTTWVEVSTSSVYPPGLELVTSVPMTATTAQVVPSCFNSRFRSYRVVISGVRINTGETSMILRYRNGATVENTAVYYDARMTLRWSDSTPNYAYNNGGTSQILGSIVTATNAHGVDVFIDRPFVTQRTTYFNAGADSRVVNGGARWSSGFCNTNTSYNGFQLEALSGASFLAEGVVSVFGYRT